jgi:hypothetical protein
MKRIVMGIVMMALFGTAAHAVELKLSAQALERTLAQQLFKDNGRYYMRGKADSACYVYAENPKVSFNADRVVIHVTTHSKLGTALRGTCLGVGLNADADVSVLPEAQGESIGFRDARIDNLSESKELNYFLIPFLSKKLPQEMKINIADQLRAVIATSNTTIGYTLTLDELKVHSMVVSGNALVVDFDGAVSVK